MFNQFNDVWKSDNDSGHFDEKSRKVLINCSCEVEMPSSYMKVKLWSRDLLKRKVEEKL